MRIAFDLRRIKNPGIGRYMKGIVGAIAAISPQDRLLLILPEQGEQYLDIPPGAEIVYAKSTYYSFREQIEIPKLLRSWNADLLHAPHFVVPLLKVCPTVVTIHDVIHLVYPQDLPSTVGRIYANISLSLATRFADEIITDSEFSKSEIVRYLHVQESKVTAAHLGSDATLKRVTDDNAIAAVRQQLQLSTDFMLYAGIYKDRKNHTGLLQAFALILAENIDCDLVIAGPLEGGATEIEKQAKQLGIWNRLRLTGFIRDEQLAALYSAATVYACPSLYEGFGFTVLEAAACGTPVVAHRGSSLVEVGGNGVLFADARVPREFADALSRVLRNGDVRQDLVTRGYENLSRFSWTACAEATIQVYRRALAKTHFHMQQAQPGV